MANENVNVVGAISLAEFVGTRDKVGQMAAAFRFGVSLGDHRHGVFYLPFGIGGHIVRDGDGYKASFTVWSAQAPSLDDAEAALYGLVREHRPGLLAPSAVTALTRRAAQARRDAERAPEKPKAKRA